MSRSSFGARFAAAPDAAARLALEQAENRRGELIQLDAVLDDLILRALRGERVFVYDKGAGDRLDVNPAQGSVLEKYFSVAGQEGQGAWYLPQDGAVSVGMIDAAWAGLADPRLMMSTVDARGVGKHLRDDPAWFAAWSVLDPFFAQLLRPLELRGQRAGRYDAARLEKEWAAIDAFDTDLGHPFEEQLAALRPGGGWSRLDTAGKTRVRAELVQAWAAWATPEVVGSVRTWAVGQLAGAYYNKAKGSSQALSRKVLTRPLQRVLSGYFAGDWLAFLAYLGEHAHPSEEVITALPEPKLFVAKASAEQADRPGVPAGEVEKILAAFYGDEQASSPVLRRVDALKQYWQAFDQLHAEQTETDETLWGLIDEAGPYIDTHEEGFQPGLAQQRLPQEIRDLILRWWGTSVNPRAPLTLVSQTDPYGTLSATFGPALAFWQEAALVAFAHCEARGHSRSSLKQLTATERAAAKKFGVSPEFFRELEAAEALLPPEPERDDTSTHYRIESEEHPGIGLEVSLRIGSGLGPRKRRGGWPILNEVLTRHRRQWAAEQLDRYLQQRWDTDLREAAATYNRLLVAKGKPPTARQLIGQTRDALDRWFGGDVDQLHRALGQRSPGEVTAAKLLLPPDRRAFTLALRRELGGAASPSSVVDDDGPTLNAAETRRWNGLTRLAEQGGEYVQLWEALGQRPERKQFRLTGYAEMCLDHDPDRAFALYAAAVDRALANPTVAAAAAPGSRPQLATTESAGNPPGDDPQAAAPVTERKGLFARLLGGG